FAGEYADIETGFVYLRARYYDPATGQFLSRDPLVAVTRSAYSYAAGDPLDASDPTGLKCIFRHKHGGCVGGSIAHTAGAFVGGMLGNDCSYEKGGANMVACSFGFATPYAMV